ncbi:MAG TPA: glycosyltransferase [Bacillota bacterium]|nr:glycosyltransferase [Bacillota bacterium]HOL10485.1 glycosyltransferase [Bacillota bacterium]HPO98228.1 glycosyltransferase [Bacillota bacterium]
MRIGVFTNCYHPMVNGVVGVVNLVRRGLLEKGHEVYIFAPAFDDYVDVEENVYRFKAVDLTKEVKYPIAIPYSRKINQVLNGLELDIIHTHHPFVLGPLAASVASKKRVPVIYTFHTQYELYNHYVPLPKTLVNQMIRRRIKNFCMRVDGVTTPADTAKQLLLEYQIAKPIQVIPNPTIINTQKVNGDHLKIKYGLQDERILINTGRIAPEKNLGLLLRAFKYILERSSDSIKLMIVGDGPELNNLKVLANELAIADQVIFTGLVPPEQIPEYLAIADLFVMTSMSEVRPLAQLEALAVGVPVVSVKAPGAQDNIVSGENGLLVSTDVADIGDNVISLLSDHARMRVLKENAIKSSLRYDYRNITQEYLNFYQQIITEYQKPKQEVCR